ncbi:hypothetical protein G6F65_021026 [Rhizopus arrhizus]|nr:hypothetical protein G6F65_021026 [Rhizopus arrhizus]
MQPARIQREHFQVQARVVDGVRQHHGFGRQRGRERRIGIAALDLCQALGQLAPALGQPGIQVSSNVGRAVGNHGHGCTAKMRARRGRANKASPSRRSSSRYRYSGTSASMMASESSRASSR